MAEIVNICKDILFDIFSERLFEKLQQVSGYKVREESEFDQKDKNSHPIFNRIFQVYTMVAQDENTILKIEKDLNEKFKAIDNLDSVSNLLYIVNSAQLSLYLLI